MAYLVKLLALRDGSLSVESVDVDAIAFVFRSRLFVVHELVVQCA